MSPDRKKIIDGKKVEEFYLVSILRNCYYNTGKSCKIALKGIAKRFSPL